MSKRIAVALAATIAAAVLATNTAQARPELVPVHGAEYSHGNAGLAPLVAQCSNQSESSWIGAKFG